MSGFLYKTEPENKKRPATGGPSIYKPFGMLFI